MKNTIIISLLLLIPILFSCNKDFSNEIEETQPVSSKESSIVCKTICGCNAKLQSDPEVIILQHIIFYEGNYFLNMTEDESVQLGIETNLYQKYVNHVIEMNENL